MKLFAPMMLAVTLTGCASIGWKQAMLTSPDSKWRISENFGRSYYLFSCNQTHLSVDEIVIKTHISAMGPILPIIPATDENDYGHDDLEIKLEIFAPANQQIAGASGLSVTAGSPAQVLTLVSAKTYDFSSDTAKEINQSDYKMYFRYQQKLEDLSDLDVKFHLPMAQCEIPDLILNKKQISDDQFIWSPGP